jgi:hypothetical protein
MVDDGLEAANNLTASVEKRATGPADRCRFSDVDWPHYDGDYAAERPVDHHRRRLKYSVGAETWGNPRSTGTGGGGLWTGAGSIGCCNLYRELRGLSRRRRRRWYGSGVEG